MGTSTCHIRSRRILIFVCSLRWHQDIKPENILVASYESQRSSEWQFKLADLGTSKYRSLKGYRRNDHLKQHIRNRHDLDQARIDTLWGGMREDMMKETMQKAESNSTTKKFHGTRTYGLQRFAYTFRSYC